MKKIKEKNIKDEIYELKKIFESMCTSRKKIKPLLSEIVHAIDNNVFINVDSQNVKDLLEDILKLQSELEQKNELKQAVSTKKLAVVEDTISDMNRRQIIVELKEVLSKFKSLVCDSSDSKDIEAVKQLQRQAKKLLLKIERMEFDQCKDEGSKFIDVVEKIENPEKYPIESFLEIQNNFPDNRALAFIIMRQLLHFEESNISDIQSYAPTEKKNTLIEKIQTLSNKYDLSLNLLFFDEIIEEKKTLKKELSQKALNKKLRDFIDGNETLAFSILKNLCNYRIYSDEIIFEEKNDEKKREKFPIVVEQLYNWGMITKFQWKDLNFKYLTDIGYDRLVKMPPLKEKKLLAKVSLESQKSNISSYMCKFILFSTIETLKLKNFGENEVKSEVNNFWAQSILRLNKETRHVVFAFSLMFFDKNWIQNIALFFTAYEKVKNTKAEIKGVFLISTLESEQLNSWIAFFKSLGMKNLYKYLISKEEIKIIDESEKNYTVDEWLKHVKFGIEENSIIIDDESKSEKKVQVKKSKLIKKNVNETTQYNVTTINDEQLKLKNDDTNIMETETDIFKVSSKDEETKHIKEILEKVTKFFMLNRCCHGMLFLHILSMQESAKNENWATHLCSEIGYILDDPIYFAQSNDFDPFDFWNSYYSIPNVDINNLYDYLNLAALIKSFFAPPKPMSFQLKNRWNQLNDDRLNIAVKLYPSTKKLINLFKNFTDQTHTAFSDCINFNDINTETELKQAINMINTARNRIEVELHRQIKHPRTKGLVKQLYDKNGEIQSLLNIDKADLKLDELIAFCQQFSDKDLEELYKTNTIDENLIENSFSTSKINDYLEDIWSKIKVDTHKGEKFVGEGRNHQRKLFLQIVTAIMTYVFAINRAENIKKSINQTSLVDKALEILDDILKELDNDTQTLSNFTGQTIFKIFIENLIAKIKGIKFPPFYSECLLGSQYIELTDNFLPIIESYDIDSFSFTNRILKFESAITNLTIEDSAKLAYETAVRSCDLGILTLIENNFRHLLNRSDEDLKKRRENVGKQVDRQIERIYHEFLDNLELDRNYDRITNQEEIDQYIKIAAKAKEHFTNTKNAGMYQRFISACKEKIKNSAQPHKEAIEQRLINLESTLEGELNADEQLNEKYLFLNEIHHQLEIGNLTVAEDYLNRWFEESGNFNRLGDLESKNEPFNTFLSEYEIIFNVCIKNKSESLEKIYSKMRIHIKNYSARSTRDANDFVSAWQGLNTDTKSRAEISVVELLKHLSFKSVLVDTAEKIPPNQWKIHVTFPSYRRSKAAYPHPFAIYGTEIAQKGLTVIYLASNRTADNIVETLASSVKSDCGIICVVDFALSLAERRKLAQAFKTRYDLKDILVIDRVMAIYLTRFEDSVRGVKLLKTALPFARVQPYTTGGVVAPEMFIGRSKELAKIRDMHGPVFVYGGRQLGKSALLRQVRNIDNEPDQGNFAFFIEIKGLDSYKSLEKIVRELQEVGLLNKNKDIGTWEDFSIAMKDLLSGKAEKFSDIAKGKTPKKLILLLDESDEFLASIANSPDSAIDKLRELRDTFIGKFKFVLAGLHKVIRFEKNLAFGNLDHLSVLPFTPTDALELLIKPLSFLGFIIEDESLTSAIFSRANYYPGLIQYYCKMIVDAAGDNYTQHNFDITKNPPYKLDDEYLKNMLGKRDFQDEINKKFQITLKLDDDNYYEIIALVIAEEYYNNNRPVHVSSKQIKETCEAFGISKIADMNENDLENLLSEMVELNLLRKIDGQYEFNRYAFWHMMGSDVNEIEKRLDSYGKGR